MKKYIPLILVTLGIILVGALLPHWDYPSYLLGVCAMFAVERAFVYAVRT